MAIVDNVRNRGVTMSKKTAAYWEEWADALLCAGAAGDDEAAGLYPVAQALSRGGELVSSTDLLLLMDYIRWVEKNNRG